MAQSRLAAPVRGHPELPAASSGAAQRPSPRLPDGVHYVPNDSHRFPICGSWRSNWSHTGDAAQATCPECRVRLAQRPLPDGAGEE